MPIYAFECQECHKRFDELIRNATDLADIRCPECGSEEVRREVTAPSLGGGNQTSDGGYVAPRGGNCSPFS